MTESEFNAIYNSRMSSRPINSSGLGPVIGHTDKSCIASYYRRFSTNINIKLILFSQLRALILFARKAVYNTME